MSFYLQLWLFEIIMQIFFQLKVLSLALLGEHEN